MSNDEWLQSLKPGDEVVVSFGGWMTQRSVEQVEKITPTQILVDRKRFRRTTGWQVGSGYDRAVILEATAERKAEIAESKRRRILIGKIESVRWKQMPTAVLEQVGALLEAAAKPETPPST